jgi:hypothetical protein
MLIVCTVLTWAFEKVTEQRTQQVSEKFRVPNQAAFKSGMPPGVLVYPLCFLK